MSGSPIIQDGKLVGAVTHVLVNDPTRGYGIFIENMLDAAEQMILTGAVGPCLFSVLCAKIRKIDSTCAKLTVERSKLRVG